MDYRNQISFEEWYDKLWVPDLVIINTEDTVHTMYIEQEMQSIVHAQLKSPNKSFTADLDHILFDFIYGGEDIVLEKQNEYTQMLLCVFNWMHYPFDTQVKNSFSLISAKNII